MVYIEVCLPLGHIDRHAADSQKQRMLVVVPHANLAGCSAVGPKNLALVEHNVRPREGAIVGIPENALTRRWYGIEGECHDNAMVNVGIRTRGVVQGVTRSREHQICGLILLQPIHDAVGVAVLGVCGNRRRCEVDSRHDVGRIVDLMIRRGGDAVQNDLARAYADLILLAVGYVLDVRAIAAICAIDGAIEIVNGTESGVREFVDARGLVESTQTVIRPAWSYAVPMVLSFDGFNGAVMDFSVESVQDPRTARITAAPESSASRASFTPGLVWDIVVERIVHLRVVLRDSAFSRPVSPLFGGQALLERSLTLRAGLSASLPLSEGVLLCQFFPFLARGRDTTTGVDI